MKKILYLSLLLIFLIPGQNSRSQWSVTLLPRLEDFRVNDDGSGFWQANPNVAVGGNGHFIVVWDDSRIGYTHVYCQIYNSDGIAIGGNVKVNEHHNLHHQYPSVAADSSGNFVVVWSDARSGSTHIYGQYFQSGGTKLGINFKISGNADQISSGNPHVGMNKSGEFFVVWENAYPSAKHVYGQRYTSNRIAYGGNVKINDNSVLLHVFPDAAIDNNGNVIAVWTEQESGQYDIYGQRYDPYGNPVSGNFKINDETNNTNQMHPVIDRDEKGNFVVVWNDWRDGPLNIYCQQFEQSGDKIDSNFRINDPAVPCDVTFPDLTVDDQGYFVASWPHPVKGIYGRLFDPSGNPMSDNFQIDSGSENTRQLYPKVALYNNQLCAAWRDNRLESQWDIFANILTEQMAEQVEIPAFDPLPGTFTGGVTVSMQCATDGAVIRYTTDGTVPTASSPAYTGPVSISATATLKARAYKEGLFPSDVQSGMYTIEPDPAESYDGLAIVHLQQGWNCFSFDVQPANLQVAEILKGIEGKFNWVVGYENGIEVAYHPDSAGVNTLLTLNPLHGYYIHMLKEAVLSISGTEITASTPIPLSQGVHLISYLPDDTLPVQEALQSIWDHVELVKTIDPSGIANGQGADGGISFDPAFPDYNTLQTMQNGFGYEIQVDAGMTLVYPEVVVGSMLASATIGPEGGTLSTNEFMMTVPEGAFASAFHLSLYRFTEDLSYGEEVNSASFAVTGMPDDFALPIRLAIKYIDDLSEQSFIAAGERTFIPELNDYEYIPFMYEATDSMGYCVIRLPAGESGEPDYWTGPSSKTLQKNTKSNIGITVYNVLRGWRSHQSKYFTFVYSFLSAYSSDIPVIAPYFDDVVQTGIGGTGMGFNSFELDLLKSKLMHVVVERDESKVDYLLKTKPYKGAVTSDALNKFNRCTMHFNEKLIDKDHDLLKQKAGILVFGLRQWMAFNDQQYWSWLNYAYQMWIGQRFTNLPDFYNPYALSSFEEKYLIPRPFLGLEAGGVMPEGFTTDPNMVLLLKKVHGHGMVSFIKYIEKERKLSEVKKLWDTFNPKSPMDAIFKAFPSSEDVWWPDYSAKYVQGDYYNITDKTMLNTIHKDNVFTVNMPIDTLKYFDNRYPDFSSALYRVDLKHDDINSIEFVLGPASLNLDYITFHVFMLRNELFEYYGQGIQYEKNIKLTVNQMQSYINAGIRSLVVLVVNSANEPPYTGDIHINLDVRIDPVAGPYNYGIIKVKAVGQYTYSYGSSSSGPLLYADAKKREGIYLEPVFTSVWNEPLSNGTSSGELKVTLDLRSGPPRVTGFYVTETQELGDTKTYTFSGDKVNIPAVQTSAGYYKFRVSGMTDTRNNLKRAEYDAAHSDGTWTSLTSFKTDQNSYIEIVIGQE